MRATPVCISDYTLQENKVHEPELGNWGLQVEINDMLPADSLQILGMTHPCQVVDNLLIPGDLDAIPAHIRDWATSLAQSIVMTHSTQANCGRYMLARGGETTLCRGGAERTSVNPIVKCAYEHMMVA